MNFYWRLPSPVRLLIMMVPALVLAWVLDDSTVAHALWYGGAGVVACAGAWGLLEHRHTRHS